LGEGVNNLRSDPWPHLVLDDFLPHLTLERSAKEINSRNYQYGIESRGTGRIEFAVLESETLWRALYSARTITLLSDAFGLDVTLNKHNMMQLRRMSEDTPEFPLHNDFTSGEDTIASFLYISRGWSCRCGGRLQLFASNAQRTPSISIEPIENRFVAFRTEAAHWHSVEKVYSWERLSVLALWNVDGSAVS
jgi:hypothetical protein